MVAQGYLRKMSGSNGEMGALRAKSSVRSKGFIAVCIAAAAAALATLPGCGGSSGTTPSATALNQTLGVHSDAALSELQITAMDPGVSPFIEWLSVHASTLASLASVEFTVQPKAGSASKAVDVTYSKSALATRGFLGSGDDTIRLPVYGLYAGYTNSVTLRFGFADGSAQVLTTSITTTPYSDPTGIYTSPTILKQRAVGASLGFNFFYIKSGIASPIVLDTDGEIRWAVPGVATAGSSALQDDEFVIGNAANPTVQRVRLDGTIEQDALGLSSVANFHHNIDFGKTGLLAEINTVSAGGLVNEESNVIEMNAEGTVFNHWDLAAIISAYMASMGDDPSAFVRSGADWFHNNATAYDPSDDSILVSSRENFVIKLDYQTGAIIWILGDPTKYWYTFASLRAKALTLAPGGLYPIGQHAISITSSGHLLLFNDGYASVSQPAGAPTGENRSYSAVSAYSIDAGTMSATNIWNFDNGQSVYSPVCSSAYKAPQESLLVDYATADDVTHALLLDSTRTIILFSNSSTRPKAAIRAGMLCRSRWRALPSTEPQEGIWQKH